MTTERDSIPWQEIPRMVEAMENITFGWYLKKISWLALIGFFAGAAVYLVMNL